MATGILPASLLGSVAIVNTTTGIDGAAVRIVEEPERPIIYTVQGGAFYYQAISRSYITLRVSAVGYITKDQCVNLKPSTLNQVVVFLTKV